MPTAYIAGSPSGILCTICDLCVFAGIARPKTDVKGVEPPLLLTGPTALL